MHFFVTGCSGFIGSNLVDRLLHDGHKVTGYDNFSTGRREFLIEALKSDRFNLLEGDVLDTSRLSKTMQQVDFVFHLAANADVRHGTTHPAKDIEQNAIGTFSVLEAMRENRVRRVAFSSTGAIYGEPKVFPTPEDCPFPVQTSLYGASKLAGEALISAYSEGYDMQGYIFRFVSILGERYTHGHVIDFYKKLVDNPDQIEVLGDGKQCKSYLYVQDCVAAMLAAIERPQIGAKVNLFNLGTDEYCTVDQSLGWICERLGVGPRRQYTGGQRGWIGDSPFVFLDCTRIRSLGWKPKLTIRQSGERTLDFLRENTWLFERP